MRADDPGARLAELFAWSCLEQAAGGRTDMAGGRACFARYSLALESHQDIARGMRMPLLHHLSTDDVDVAGLGSAKVCRDVRTQDIQYLVGLAGACVTCDGLGESVLAVEQIDHESVDQLDLANTLEDAGVALVLAFVDPQADARLADLPARASRTSGIPTA